ncbi:hypothetical protein JG688_00014329 [Phytophthora aleatoria]|uniref:Uncharacterized protein n=1 Tax=Phytophthora aleatoria TaxID=2496075 RepID=A0A8J5I7I2_9STRA|nr:hypothetical protein JG688_00014329 [Phytophthora aleatoria]
MGLLEYLKNLDSVCKTWQVEGTSMADVRLLFDQVTDDYPVMVSDLRQNANIVHATVFEAALVKFANTSIGKRKSRITTLVRFSVEANSHTEMVR